MLEIRPLPRVPSPPRLEADAARPGAPEHEGDAGGDAVRDRVTVSAEARRRAERLEGSETPDRADQALIASLSRRDAQVRAHEAAHQSAGAGLTGGASFTFQLGPDGKNYAIGGEVPVRMQGGQTPDETIAIAGRIRRAALAPADPSAQDLAIATSASAMEAAARAEKARGARAGKAYGHAGAGSRDREPAPGEGRERRERRRVAATA